MRSIVLVAILLAGCAGGPSEPAPETSEDPAPDPVLPDPSFDTVAAASEPRVLEFELAAMCSAYANGVYARPCPGDDGIPSSKHFRDIAVENATTMIIEAELLEGDKGQLLAGEGRSSHFHRETITDAVRFVITQDQWGSLEEVVVEIQGATQTDGEGADVWASGPLRMAVTVSAFDVTPDDDYCARCT